MAIVLDVILPRGTWQFFVSLEWLSEKQGKKEGQEGNGDVLELTHSLTPYERMKEGAANVDVELHHLSSNEVRRRSSIIERQPRPICARLQCVFDCSYACVCVCVRAQIETGKENDELLIRSFL